ncbi:diadenosine tetraphosphate (Ap4A) HIT family hydrolase [Herbaspirillum sp. SJZ130]|nr:diadenosine tetraphosphate (Ap4A) HIT family hydrolase [Herbaspirillum sp. SJZ102]TQK05886.1 diadenosine tetraphosphate (Ap4A) HIT family hydrolase [Herbaspirillum sp. SJZ130]TQK12636.1 diadenosine tetraphosphate (Ap4A) HIT family hydrolase [Herbaspirillum sp. SJZ106]TWC62109.1 diadenosine tetraphosphate (Ap4A) HIT family hydrolase [Herbaspirillum sp. SJZ099]
MMSQCELCAGDGGELVWRHPDFRVVLVDEAGYPGFCRVIWNGHVKEMTDLAPAERTRLADAVWAVEAALREVMQPEKVNLATLGNMTPHVHWHVIPRYLDDQHFPTPVWATARREADQPSLEARRAKLPQLREAIRQQLSAAGLGAA